MKKLYARELREAIGYLGEQPLLLVWRGRRLVENHRYEEGYACLKKAEEISGGSTYVREAVLDYFRKRGWKAEVEEMLERLGEDYFLRRRVSWLKESGFYRKAAEAAETAYREHVLSPEEYLAEILPYGKEGKVTALVSSLGEHLPEYRPRFLLREALFFLSRGEYAKAEDTCRKILSLDPFCTPAVKVLFEEAMRKKDGAAAERYLRRLADLGEDVPGVYRRLRALRGERLYVARFDVELAKAFAPARLNPALYPSSHYVNLLDVSCLQVHPDGSYEGLVHNAYLVVSKRGVEKMGEVRLPRDPDSLLFCRTIARDGKVYLPVSIKEAGDARYASMPHVAPGSVVEYAYLVEGTSGGAFEDFSVGYDFGKSDEPTLKAVLAVACPADKRLYWFSNRKEGAPREKVEGGYRVYYWERNDLPNIPDEVHMPSPAECAETGRVQGRDGDFSRCTRYFYRAERFHGARETEDLGDKIREGVAHPDRIVDAYLAWIHENIEDGGRRRTVRDCIALRRGDSALKRKLLRYWLTRGGIPCGRAWVNTQFFLRENREADPASLVSFRRALVFVYRGLAAPARWVDIHPFFRYGDPALIDADLVHAAALYEREGLLVAGRVREKRDGLLDSEYTVSFRLEETGDAKVKASGYVFGLLAARLRKLVMEDRQKGKRIREALARKILPRLDVSANSFEGIEKRRGPVAHRFTGRIYRFARREGEALTFSPFFRRLDIESLVGKPNRENDFVLRSPRFVRYTGEYILPKGYAVCGIPERCAFVSRYGMFVVDFAVKGGRVRGAVSFMVPAMRITPAGYRSFLGFLKEVKDHLKKRIVIVPMKVPGEAVPVSAFPPVKR